MNRRLAATLFVAALVMTASAPGAKMRPRFEAQDCRQVALVDAASGAPIAGAEDIALTPDGRALIVSAHDRLDSALQDGGLYAVAVRALGGDAPVFARPLVDSTRRALPFRPHGIAVSPDGTRLALVNRTARRDGAVEIGTLGGTTWRSERIMDAPHLCRANDLAFVPGGALAVTIDRADCTASVRDTLPGSRTGSVAIIEDGHLRIVATGLRFPNGIALGTVAETRGERLLRPEGRTVALPGAPDNLSADGEALIVAVHPGLLRLWMYLNGWADRAPSRILRVTPDDRIELLFDDPSGALFSGATVGVMVGDALVAGSARDSGLLVCGAPA